MGSACQPAAYSCGDALFCVVPPPPPPVLTRSRVCFRRPKCGNTGSPCRDKPVLGQKGGWGY